MNNERIKEKMWPNNGTVMIMFNNYNMALPKTSDLHYDTNGCFVIVNTVHEDDLEWEKEYVEAELILFDNVETLERYAKNYSYMNKIIDQEFGLQKAYRIALRTEWDDPIEEGDDDFVEFEQNRYSSILLKAFINDSKTKVVFLGNLIE